jgi:transcriptional regulator with XRE-family HTH domain
VNPITGAMLRELRLRHDLGLRAVARRAGGKVQLSDGHLSRVERGQRPVTPAVIATYERALGTRIHPDTIAHLVAPHQPDHADRRAFHTTIATLAATSPVPGGGGVLGGYEHRLAQDTGFPHLPTRISAADVDHLTQATATLRRLDLAYGGELTAQMGCHLLRWAIRLCGASMSEHVTRRWHAAVGTLAASTAWAAHDACQPAAARTLFTIALDAAVHADEPDLRANVLADIAAHHNHAGHPADALHALRLGDGDERVHPAIQAILHAVRARTYATLAEPARCHREITRAEHLAATVDSSSVPGWLDGWQPAHVQAMLGHAYADLTHGSGDPADLDRAQQHLSTAAGHLAAVRPRAAALALTHLARTHRRCGDPDEAARLTTRAEHLATDLRSSRVNRDLAALHAAVDAGQAANSSVSPR